ncbi:MAG: hypothetical protein ACXWWD_12220 [Chitinophagaceae bacterium]
MMINRVWILLCLLLTNHAVTAQDTLDFANARFVSLYLRDIDGKIERLDKKLNKHTTRILKRVKARENDLRRKLAKRDSLKVRELFINVEEQYKRLANQGYAKPGQQYIPSLDTIISSLKFLQQNPSLPLSKGAVKIKESIVKINELGSQLEKAGEVKKFLNDRKLYLEDRLQQAGITKELKKLTKQAWYYSEQLNEYKSLLGDHTKAEKKMIQFLGKSKMFQNFMRKNSLLASLFGFPNEVNAPFNTASIGGLQTRTQVNSFIQQQTGTGAVAQLQQNLGGAQSQLEELKRKTNRQGPGNSDANMPEGFKFNSQKTKTFLQRLELGTNIQSQKANSYFPATSDLGLSLGYKLNDKSVLGIGASYKIGWGKDIRHIHITHQGVGLRSFLDWKIKGSVWMSGGYEMNYGNEFKRLVVLKDLKAWRQCGLLGISKVISLKTKFFTKTKFQLFWDFLSYEQVPKTQPIVFRIGYAIK